MQRNMAMASSLRSCSRCKKSKDDVELRQSDELLCQAYPSESLREEIPYHNIFDTLRVLQKYVKS